MYRVLIVEDEPGYIMLYKNSKVWNRCDFMIADTARHGREAMEKLDKAQFDLIFTDIRMPFMDGVDLLKAIRAKGMTDLPVIFSSSHNDFIYAQQGIVYGLFDYILKPVDDKVLESTLNRVKNYLTGKNENKIHQTVLDLLKELDIEMANDDFIFQVCAYCSENFKEPFILGDFASIFGYSNDHFTRLFRQHFGMTFKEFSGRVKVAYAIEYLRAGTYTVGQIAELLGFQNVDYFRELFKNITGVRPIDYKFGTKGEFDA